ncbi:unnamed protein product [Toxocara canis]|uniref:Claspin n=1 Tax=Toxocara canis TaxID=6265 RepID=A0A183UD80_TOXCA|nr:unnamed protein product [Toxocara canis]
MKELNFAVDASNEADQFVLSASNPYLSGRRRRMSLLQTLRYQNKQLADSGFECHQSDKAERDLASPSALLQKRYSESPPSSPVEEEAEQKLSSSSFTKLKAKTKALFAKKGEKKSHMLEQRGDISSDVSSRCGPSENERAIYSCIDFTAKEKAQRKSPSINDSGRGSQGRLCPDDEHPEDTAEHERERNDRRETVAVIERTPLEGFMNRISKSAQLRRSISCPQLGLNLRIYHEILHRTISVRNHGNSLDSDTDEEDEDDFECSARDVRQRLCERDQQIVRGTPSLRSEKSEEAEGIVEKEEVKFAERMFRNSSPLSAADFLLEKRLRIRALLMQRQQEANATSEESLKQSNDSGTPNSLPKQMSGPSFSTFSAESVHAAGPADEMNNNDELTAKLEKVALAEADTRSTGTHASEELDEDDNASTILLDQYLPIISDILFVNISGKTAVSMVETVVSLKIENRS